MSEVVTKNDLTKILNRLPSMVLSDAEIITNLYDYISNYGVKNLLPYPYVHTTSVINGITWTDNGDGTITANGTATGRSTFYLRVAADQWLIPVGNYRIVGCPEGGGWSTDNMKYRIWINYRKGDSDTGYGSDIGDGLNFTVIGDEEAIGAGLQIEAGQTVNNLIFKPMVRLADSNNDEWRPFAKSNTDLTQFINISDTTKQTYRDLGCDI